MLLPHSRSFVWLAAALVLTSSVLTTAQSKDTQRAKTSDSMPHATRGLQAVDADSCLDVETTTATVNSTLQIQTQQPLQNQSLQANLLSGLSQYLRVPDCNLQLTYNSSTACPVSSTANSTDTCLGGSYICRGVTQVPLNVYSAVQDNDCTPDATGSTVSCLGTSLDLTTYLSVQQGQCCLQCPGQSDCTADASQASASSPQTALALYECGNFTLGVVVSDVLEGSSLEDLLDVAVSGGLLDLYLQSSGLTDSSAISLGPTGRACSCLRAAYRTSHCWLTRHDTFSAELLLLCCSSCDHAFLHCFYYFVSRGQRSDCT